MLDRHWSLKLTIDTVSIPPSTPGFTSKCSRPSTTRRKSSRTFDPSVTHPLMFFQSPTRLPGLPGSLRVVPLPQPRALPNPRRLRPDCR